MMRLNLHPEGDLQARQPARWEGFRAAAEVDLLLLAGTRGAPCPGCGSTEAHQVVMWDPCPVAGLLRMGQRWGAELYDEYVRAWDATWRRDDSDAEPMAALPTPSAPAREPAAQLSLFPRR